MLLLLIACNGAPEPPAPTPEAPTEPVELAGTFSFDEDCGTTPTDIPIYAAYTLTLSGDTFDMQGHGFQTEVDVQGTVTDAGALVDADGNRLYKLQALPEGVAVHPEQLVFSCTQVAVFTQ
jgi:hypothetical protein